MSHSVTIYEIDQTVYHAAQLYPIISQLQPSQISLNLQQMIALSGAQVPPQKFSLGEYVSGPAEGKWQILTNKTGQGGWFFNSSSKTLSLNITNPVKLRFEGHVVNLPEDLLVVAPDGVHLLARGQGSNLSAHFDELVQKASLVLEFAQPTNPPAAKKEE